MAAISWKSAVSGDWATAANWIPGKVPGIGDAVTIAFPGFYTVTLTTPVTVGSIAISNTSAFLSVQDPGKTETVSGSVSNSGSLQVDTGGPGGTTLKIGGTLTNLGTFSVGNGAATATTKVGVAAVNNTSSIILTGGAVLTVAGGLTNNQGSFFQVDTSGSGGSQLTVGKVLTENGTLLIGNLGLTRTTTVTAAGIAGTGSITMNEGNAAPATLSVTGAAPATLFGTYNLSGNALIEFGNGGVSAIGTGAGVTLNGAKALIALKSAPTSNSALTGLAQNAGTLTLQNGAAVAPKGAFDNSGTMMIDTAGTGGSSFAIGGALTNESSLQIGNIGITAATKVSVKALNNFGSISEVSDAAAATSTLTVTGAFLNGHGDFLQIDNTGAGGSQLKVGGVLTNNGNLFIGNTALTRATTVTAAGLAGAGSVTMNEGTFKTATLDVTGAAPATLYGTYSLSGSALIEFGSGGASAIGTGTSVTLNGAEALIALKSAPTSNSALTGLAQNAGTVTLQNGAALAPKGAFDNSGTMVIDTGGAGGSSLSVGGVLTNEGSLQIGNIGITAATKVSAKGLNNFGSISEVSDAAAATSTLAVTGAFLNGHGDFVLIDSSGAGGSQLTVGGALTNNGTIFIGNTTLTRATTVKVTGASSDTGAITVSGRGVLTLGNTLTVSGSLNLNGGTVSGGTLATAGKGSMQAATSVVSTLSAVTIAAGSIFSVATGGTLVDSGVTVKGALVGNGGATLDFAKATTAASLSNISGFATIGLANTANVLTLAAANFAGTAGVITINDGSKGNTVTATTLPAGDAITVHAGKGADLLKGGAGNDIFFAGGNTTMTGAKGANEFVFSAAGSGNAITDFTASAANEMLFVSGSGFSLPGATESPQPLGALFTQNATGAFTATSQRFAYDKTDGHLFYSGNGTTASEHLVAVVSGHPTLNPAHLLFST